MAFPIHGILSSQRRFKPLKFMSSITGFQIRHLARTASFPRTHVVPKSTSSSRFTSFSDPSRPDLFYHLLQPPNPLFPTLPAFALSFLPFPPTNPESSTVIGWLPAQVHDTDGDVEREVVKGDVSARESGEPVDAHVVKGGSEDDQGLDAFKENPKFLNFLHETIKTGLTDEVDHIQMNGAKGAINGWMHIHDQKSVPIVGPIGDSEDIIASVLVENSVIKPETYQRMPSYRLCSNDGVMQLTPGLTRRLHDALITLAEVEKANSIRESIDAL